VVAHQLEVRIALCLPLRAREHSHLWRLRKTFERYGENHEYIREQPNSCGTEVCDFTDGDF
jgi:hypothetical protein